MSEVGLFGKVPTKGDFVRHNIASEVARQFENWVQESNDALRSQDLQFPAHPVRMLFAPKGASQAVVALLVPSQDQVGRKYPFVVFSLIAAGEATSHFSAIPVAWNRFLQDATQLAARAQTADIAEIKSAVEHLHRAGDFDYQQATQMGSKVLQYPVLGDFHDRVFGGDSGAPYGYQTFLTACQNASKSGLILDCPLSVDVDLFIWLEMARRIYGTPSNPPSYFWIEEPAPRLLLSLGEPHLVTLQLLGQPEMEHPRLWPLTTHRETALQSAHSAMADILRGLTTEHPLERWLGALAAGATGGM